MSTETKIVQKDTFKIITSTVNKMVDFIRPTFGPASNKIIIDKLPYRMVCDDGVQAARDFESNDPVENAIVRLIRTTAVTTNDRVGDGTTGALIMLQAIINEVARKSKFDGRKIELELKKGLEEVRTQLKKSAKLIKTKEELEKVALVSFDDKEIAKMIAETYYKLGKDGLITIDKSPSMSTTLHTTDGVKVDRGYLSPYMVNNPERMEAFIEKPYILLTDYRITETSDILPLMDKLAKAGKAKLVIIAENIEQNALATMVINQPHVMNPQTQRPGTFQSIGINLPQVENRAVFLEDLAMLTGAKVFSSAKGDKLENCEITDLGQAERIIARRDESIIVEPKGDKASVKKAIVDLGKMIDGELDENKKKSIALRLAMFKNTLAVIKVGAPTETEQRALKYKVEDCVNAVNVAFKGGVVCGGGLALSRIKTSSKILNAALQYPSHQLYENMGFDGEYEGPEDEALNVVTMKQGKFMEVGVVDPVDVLIAAVESAVSIASVLLTSSGIVVEYTPRDNKQNNQ